MKKKKLDLGFSFADFIEGRVSHLNLSSAKSVKISENWEASDTDDLIASSKEVSVWRLVPFYIIFAFALIFLAAQAFRLQVINGASFLTKSEGNHVLVRVDHATRGIIYDRSGQVLVRNAPGFRVAVRKIDLPENWEKDITELAPKIGKDAKGLIDTINKSNTDSVTLTADLTNDQAINLKASAEDFPWMSIEIDPKRQYLFGPVLSSILGYTGEVSEGDLQKSSATPYSAGDQVGKTGIEASFEKQLRGSNGFGLVKVDSQGKNQGLLFETKPVSGNDITLSIDANLQKFIYDTLTQTLKDKGGDGAAAVVQDVNTGEVLALVSAPSYDDNLFTGPIDNATYSKLINDPSHLLLDRTIGASFAPGSTFKLIVSAAGLETGAINKDTKILDTGFVTLNGITFNNWLWLDHQKTEGDINVVRALARSNDTFFYNLGEMLGPDKIAQYSRLFGLGSPTGIELPGEVAGLVPDPAWKDKTFNQVWYPGETVNYAIGQGYLLVSPLQLNVVTTAIANGGNLIAPTLIHNNTSEKITHNLVKPDTIEQLRQGMYQNTVGDGNVGYLFNNYSVKSGGKTGTAQTGDNIKPEAWYTAYAPFDKPQISVTVLFDRAGQGSELSAPEVKKIFDYWFASHPKQ